MIRVDSMETNWTQLSSRFAFSCFCVFCCCGVCLFVFVLCCCSCFLFLCFLVSVCGVPGMLGVGFAGGVAGGGV